MTDDGDEEAAGSDDERGDIADSFDAAVPRDDADSVDSDAEAGSAATAPEDADSDADDGAYSGLFGAFPYALRESDSLLFKSYAVLGGLLALGIALLFGLSVVVLLGATAAAAGGSFTFSRAFFIFVGLLVVAPLLAPVLFVARHHRREASDGRYDARLAGLGYLFVASLYVALVISTPAEQQESVADLLGTVVLFGGSEVEIAFSLAPLSVVLVPLVEFLYALPRLAGLVPPLAVAALIWRAGRRSD